MSQNLTKNGNFLDLRMNTGMQVAGYAQALDV